MSKSSIDRWYSGMYLSRRHFTIIPIAFYACERRKNMKSKITLCVVSLDRALIWNDTLEPSTAPKKLETSGNNPDYKKEHDRNESGRDRSSMNSNFLKDLAEQVQNSEKFILISSGSGKANAAEVLMSHLEVESPSTANNLIDSIKADVSNLSNDELLKLGRERWDKFKTSGN